MKTKITFRNISKNTFHIDKSYKMRGFEKIYSWIISREKFVRTSEFEYDSRNGFLDYCGYFYYPAIYKKKEKDK